MAETTSLSFPNMFNLTSNQVAVSEDIASVTERTRLLILTEPTELYNNPDFGVGLKRHMWKYNSVNERALIKDRIVEQLRLYEPDVYPDRTQFTDELLSSNSTPGEIEDPNAIKMTVAMQTTFGKEISLTLNQDTPAEGTLTINSSGWIVTENPT